MPTVCLVTAPFAAGARATARARALPDLAIVVLPADLEERVDTEIDAVLRDHLPDVVDGLCRG